MTQLLDIWSHADGYERYVGRWSRPVAHEFIAWLAPPPRLTWLDVGCGTGALCSAVLERAPRAVVGLDLSRAYVASARARAHSPRTSFSAADACALPLRDGAVEAAVSGLVLNFVSQPRAMVAEMARVTRSGGRVALYVWDYAEHMELMRIMWDAAAQLDPQAADRDEGQRFTICAPDPLFLLFTRCGLEDVQVRPIDVATVFRDFDDYWTPFLAGQGPAPGYVMSLDEPRRIALRERLRKTLPRRADGSIPLRARAWAVKGMVPA